jgi:hypothetical protein
MTSLPRLTDQIRAIVTTAGDILPIRAHLDEDYWDQWSAAVLAVREFKEAYGLDHQQFIRAVRQDVRLLAQEARHQHGEPDEQDRTAALVANYKRRMAA